MNGHDSPVDGGVVVVGDVNGITSCHGAFHEHVHEAESLVESAGRRCDLRS